VAQKHQVRLLCLSLIDITFWSKGNNPVALRSLMASAVRVLFHTPPIKIPSCILATFLFWWVLTPAVLNVLNGPRLPKNCNVAVLWLSIINIIILFYFANWSNSGKRQCETFSSKFIRLFSEGFSWHKNLF